VFDEVGGFDESLPALVEWDFLLTLTGAGRAGVRMTGPGFRYADDDVRLRESLASHRHLPAMRHIVARHQGTFEALMRTALVERERTVKALFQYERTLLTRRAQTLSDLNAVLDQTAELRPALARHGLRTFEFADLRHTSPVSRNWGSERGLPIDRRYIHRFLADHAEDVRGHVLEMLDAELTTTLTTTYGGDRVDRSEVLDIDPGNARATVIADLRVAEQLPSNVYDCFILTQTLHLIDDMPAALKTAYRVLKPGGVLLVTLPCASMVAVEYGPRGDHWRVTEAGARALFERVFRPEDLMICAHGNVLTTASFLYGLCCDDLDPDEFSYDDPAYPLLVTVRARKPAAVPHPAGRVSAGPSAAVLLYHRVADVQHDVHALAVSPRTFRSQIEHIRKSWRVLPLRRLAEAVASGDPPERAVALTFDDGYLDNLEFAAPILAELGVPATFFLTSEPLKERRRFWWDALEEMLLCADGCPGMIEIRLRNGHRSFETTGPATRRAAHDELYGIFKASAPVVRDDLLLQLAQQTSVSLMSEAHRPMVAEEARRLQAFPLIEVGAHGMHHLSLPQLSAEDCHRDVFESRSALERVVGCPVTSFAYPFGDVSPQAVEVVMAAGFHDAVSCEARGLRAHEHRLRIPRLPTREESGAELAVRIEAASITCSTG
jgi:peptidoglycan/xylan/chitin deacetylase (PgdA/CDA1 family)